MCVWFRNRNTGVEWEAEGELEKRLSESPDFERLEAQEAQEPEGAPRRRVRAKDEEKKEEGE